MKDRNKIAAVVVLLVLFFTTLAYAAFTDVNGVIRDSTTGLWWCKRVVRSNYTDAVSNTSSFTCGGYGDWRMPTKDELEDIIVDSNTPKIDQAFGWSGRYPRELNCWSSTQDPDADDWVPALRNRYMIVNFENGTSYSAIANQPHSVLYVRPEATIENPIYWDSGGDEILWTSAGDHVEWQ